jgi:hypothetical protein
MFLPQTAETTLVIPNTPSNPCNRGAVVLSWLVKKPQEGWRSAANTAYQKFFQSMQGRLGVIIPPPLNDLKTAL